MISHTEFHQIELYFHLFLLYFQRSTFEYLPHHPNLVAYSSNGYQLFANVDSNDIQCLSIPCGYPRRWLRSFSIRLAPLHRYRLQRALPLKTSWLNNNSEALVLIFFWCCELFSIRCFILKRLISNQKRNKFTYRSVISFIYFPPLFVVVLLLSHT